MTNHAQEEIENEGPGDRALAANRLSPTPFSAFDIRFGLTPGSGQAGFAIESQDPRLSCFMQVVGHMLC
jgi:hypothetical protein